MVSLTDVSLNNSIGIITVDDNTVHKYFTHIWWEQDNDTPVGYAQAKTAYHPDILKYWATYNGMIVIHAQLLKTEDDNKAITELPNTSLKSKTIEKVKTEKKDDKIEITNKEYNYSFIGHVYKVRQIGHNIIIKFNDLGWKFMQKVPMDFRKSYIAGQSLDDAFQAICEFIGVDFAYSIEDLSQYNFAADGYSIEKDGTIIEEVPSIFEEYKAPEEEEEEENLDENMANGLTDGTNESGRLPQHSNNKRKTKTQQANTNKTSNKNQNTNEALNATATNGENDEQSTEETDTVEDKIEKYQEEFEDKIKNLFIGNTIYESNVTDAILNYDAITIEPKAVTSDTSTTGAASTSTSGTNNSGNSSDGNSGSESSTPNIHGTLNPANTSIGLQGVNIIRKTPKMF